MPDAAPPADDDRRVHAFLLMANPGAEPDTDLADLLPDVQLYVHTYAGPDGDGDRPASRATARSPRTGSAACSGPMPGSRSSPSSTSPARHPWTPTRSRTDIDRPCI